MQIDKNINISTEDASPNPEYLIKSIAEQGYSLETSLADLMDNSISAAADRIEVLIEMEEEPFKLFLTDNGNGMSEEELKRNMQFPSNSPDNKRTIKDLGRFGLGMKTASFSQTRKFTVLSRPKGTEKYFGRTWDVEHLKAHGWEIIVNTEDEIDELLTDYKKLSEGHLNQFDVYTPNTIVIWYGLYKFENYIIEGKRRESLRKELNEVTVDYLSLVFHRFLERSNNPLKIRVNNLLAKPFNPFPEKEKDFRALEPMQSLFNKDVVKVEGFVLPSRSIDESRNGISIWATRNKGLMDMEGIYIYRADRIIIFGSWNGLIRKSPRLQLARMRVEVGNKVDNLLHLNVAKSQISIPHDLRKAFENYTEDLKQEAEREFYNRGIRTFSGAKNKKNYQLFERSNTNKGSLIEINRNFPLVESLASSLSSDQKIKLNLIFRMINNRINSIRQTFEEKEFIGIEEKDGITELELLSQVQMLLDCGMPKEIIKDEIIPHLGFKINTLPQSIQEIL